MPPISVYQQFCITADNYPQNPFLHIPANATADGKAVDYTYQAALAQIESLVEQYGKAGLIVGDRVALLLENGAEFFFHWLALNALGICVVPVNGELQAEEIAYLLDNSDSCLAVTLVHKKELLEQSLALIDNSPLQIIEHTQLDSRSVKNKLTKEIASAQDISSETECALLYTSGSTGKPKGCILSNDYFLSSGQHYRNLGGLCTLQNGVERLITPLPLVHMNAMAVSTVAMIMSGGCVIQLDRFHPRSWWQTVRQSKATVIHYLGVMPAILLNIDSEQDTDFSQQVKFAFGAGVNPKHHAVFEERFGFPLIESWGMTETGGGNCITANHEPRHIGSSCFGKPPKHLEVKLVDGDGSEVEFGEAGELLVRAKGDNPRRGFFSGYYKNPQATAQAWQGGWLHTGDIVRQSEDETFHFVDRIKNVIRRSGENIASLEVEAALSLIESVAQVAVTPVPDEIRGDEVFACIILAENEKANLATAQAILQAARDNLAYYKLPGYIAFMDSFPLTASNKPQRAEIKKMTAAMLEKIDQHKHCFDLCSEKKR